MSLIKRCMDAQGEARIIWLSIATAVAAAVAVSEKIIPIPVPWIKPGLANIISLIFILHGRYRDAFTIALLRTFLAAALSGGLFSIGHIFALTGAGIATIVMILLHRFARSFLSVYGFSVSGAYMHSCAQLLCGLLLFFSWGAILSIAPYILLLSLGSGLLTAWFTVRVLRHQGVENVTTD